MQRRGKRDSNVSRSASERRVTKRTVAYRPAVSIRLSRSLGFSQSPERAARAAPNGVKKGATILLVFRCLNLTVSSRKAFNGVQKGQVHSKKHKPSKKYFCWRSISGSPPAGLKSAAHNHLAVELVQVWPNPFDFWGWWILQSRFSLSLSLPLFLVLFADVLRQHYLSNWSFTMKRCWKTESSSPKACSEIGLRYRRRGTIGQAPSAWSAKSLVGMDRRNERRPYLAASDFWHVGQWAEVHSSSNNEHHPYAW